MVIRIQVPGELKLFDVIQALDGLCSRIGLSQRRQQQCRENSDDGSDDSSSISVNAYRLTKGTCESTLMADPGAWRAARNRCASKAAIAAREAPAPHDHHKTTH